MKEYTASQLGAALVVDLSTMAVNQERSSAASEGQVCSRVPRKRGAEIPVRFVSIGFICGPCPNSIGSLPVIMYTM
jgi:hypothetical protein